MYKMPENGQIILIDKPKGWTSFDVVAKLRGHFSKKEGRKVKVGHAGTLDPFATGLLIILIGQATKNQEQYMKLGKEYEAELFLGATSTTGDPEGEITKSSTGLVPTVAEINKTLKSFLGKGTQIPPKYSAIKVSGKRAYELARAGEEPILKPRDIVIGKLEIMEYEYPRLLLKTSVSSGTYIRTLAEDIGKKLGTGAYLTNLKRTKIGSFELCQANSLPDVLKS